MTGLAEQSVRADATAACRRVGSKVVSDAAYAAMAGRRTELEAIDLGHCCGNLPALSLVTRVAYGLMSDEDQAADLTAAAIAAARIGS